MHTTSRRRRLGINLIEILVAMAIMGIVMSLSFVSLKRVGGDSRAAAQLIAAQLKASRALARASNEPVALAMAKSGAHFRDFYRVRGWKKPRHQGGFSIKPDAPDTFAFAGFWTGPTFGVDLGRADLDGARFDFPSWGASNDFHYITFLPSGSVATTLPTFNNSCYLVACNGLSYGAGSVAGVTFPRLTGVSLGYTVAIQSDGRVSITRGVPNASALAQVRPMTAPGAPVPVTFPALGSNDPEVSSVQVFPDPGPNNPFTASGEVDATVKLDGFLTLKVKANDSDGDRLYCAWTADEGGFSAQDFTEMHWDSREKNWVSIREWTPPPGAEPGDRFKLKYEVKSDRGESVTGTFGVQGVLEVLPIGKILFSGAIDSTEPQADIFTINADGTDFTRLTYDIKSDEGPRWSPDGSRITFVSDRDGKHAIYTMNGDGSNLNRLFGVKESTSAIWFVRTPVFDPTGTMIAFVAMEAGTKNWAVYCIGADGALPPIGTALPGGHPGAGKLTKLWDSGLSDSVEEMLQIAEWHHAGRYLFLEGGKKQVRPMPEGRAELPENLFQLDVESTTATKLTNLANEVIFGFRIAPINDTATGKEVCMYWVEETSLQMRQRKAFLDVDNKQLLHPTSQAVLAHPYATTTAEELGWPAGSDFSPDGIYNLGCYGDISISKVGVPNSVVQLTHRGIGRQGGGWAFTY